MCLEPLELVENLSCWENIYRIILCDILFNFPHVVINNQIAICVSVQNPNIVSISFVWAGAQAPVRSFFVGTSPEFDMAVATLCAVARGNQGCHLTINGKSFTYQTYVIRHNHNQQLQITAAYPIVPAHSAPVNATGEELVGWSLGLWLRVQV